MSLPRDNEESAGPVAVVGLGAMGGRIARRLHDAGHPLLVWNRTVEARRPLLERGAMAAQNPADAAARASTVIVMVSDAMALVSVSEGRDGLMAGAHPGLQIIVMSTVGPTAVTHLAEAVPVDVDVLDAPVLGSLAEAEQGRLQILVGGADAAVGRATPVLEQIGTPIRVGGLGAGSAAKLVANYALIGTISVLGESVALADRLGLPRRSTFEVLAGTPLAEQARRRRAILDGRSFPTRYRLSLARKDADLMLGGAEASGCTLRLLPAIRSWLRDAEVRGLGEKDYLAVLTTILETAGGRGAH